MPETIKSFSNRCRCCLEKFYDDEKISKITSFFSFQFASFTSMKLGESDLLSKHVCEFCHSELLRFSVFKKDLIEKQQKLNELLKQHTEKYVRTKYSKKKNKNYDSEAILISDEDYDDDQVDESVKEEIDKEDDEEEEDEEDESALSDFTPPNSDDEKDQDFLIVRANAKPKKPMLKVIKAGSFDATNKFTCDYCELTFKAKQGLTRHVQSHIGKSIPWRCDELSCKFATSSKIKLNIHKLDLHRIPLPLTKCGGAFTQDKKVQLLVGTKVKKEEIVEEVSDFPCFCGASFTTMFSLRAHKNRMHGRRNKCTFGCENVQYVKTGHFLRHVQNKHPDKLEECLKGSEKYKAKVNSKLTSNISFEIIRCDRCDFQTLKKASLKSHMESHLPYSEREKYECDKCNKLFTRPTSLRVHRATIHEKIRKYKCAKCPQMAFKQLGHLNDHIAFKHGKKGKNQFKCTFCERYFLKRYMMNRHIRMVHKSDPRQLPLMPSSSKSSLKVERRFKCFCGKAFPFKSRLEKHQLKHDNNPEEDDLKKFKCPERGCAHAFTQRCNLIRHQKAKGHLKPDEAKGLKFDCTCGIKFFTYRGYSYHCDKMKCRKKKAMRFKTGDE